MYESHWQLSQKPFEDSADTRFYFPGETHQSALLKLRYAIENRRAGALLAGPSGSGKTLLMHMLRGGLDEQFTPIVHLVFPQMPAAELLAYLADKLAGVEPGDPHDSGLPRSIGRIEQFLADNAAAGRHAVVAVDEAHLIADTESLEALRLLLNFATTDGPGMTLLLIGQTGILTNLDRTPHFEERLAVKSLLRPFCEAETAEYVAHRLRTAGASSTIFEPDALSAIHALSHGVPRRINRLADLALLIGYAEERQTLSAEHLESVNEELVAVVPE